MSDLTPSQLNDQIKDLSAKSKAQKLPNNAKAHDPYQLRNNVATCLRTVAEITNMFKMVQACQVWFDMNYLKSEGNTDISKLDIPYMVTVGKQLVTDARALSAESLEIIDEANKLAKRSQNAIEANNPSAIATLGVDVIDQQVRCGDFAERLSTICLTSSNDIIKHLNTARTAEHQIPLIF